MIKNPDNYLMVIYIYWLVLFAWQNLSQSNTRSSIDIIIKCFLMVFLIVETFRVKGLRFHAARNRGIIWTLMTISIAFTIMGNINDISISDGISFLFALLSVFLFVVYGGDFLTDSRRVLQFSKHFIAFDLFLVVYCIIYKSAYYRQIMSITNAYGNELSAFMSSSHEFAMYMVFGIFSLLWELKYGKNNSIVKVLCIMCILLFVLHIWLSFSRTAILACVVGGLVFLYSYSKKGFFITISFLLLFALVLFKTTNFENYIYTVILKSNNSAGRDNMYSYAWQLFLSSSPDKQLFGYGFTKTTEIVSSVFRHGSFHNAYLQVMIAGGFSMLLFLLTAILFSIRNAVRIYKYDKFVGSWILSLAFSGICFMMTNTAIYFYSLIDSFILTAFCVVIPMFMLNGIVDIKNFNRGTNE